MEKVGHKRGGGGIDDILNYKVFLIYILNRIQNKGFINLNYSVL